MTLAPVAVPRHRVSVVDDATLAGDRRFLSQGRGRVVFRPRSVCGRLLAGSGLDPGDLDEPDHDDFPLSSVPASALEDYESTAGVFVDAVELATPKDLVDDAVSYSDGPVCGIVVLVFPWIGSGTLLALVVGFSSVSFVLTTLVREEFQGQRWRS